MGANSVFSSTHISTASIASELPHGLVATSHKLWPSATTSTLSSALAFKNPPSLAQTPGITNHASSAVREIKTALLDLTQPNPLPDPLSGAQRGANNALEKLATGVAQSAYNGLDGIFKLNRKIEIAPDLAPDWLKNLAENNRNQQAAEAQAVTRFAKDLPNTLSNIPSNILQTYKSVRSVLQEGVDPMKMVSAITDGINAEKMGALLTNAFFLTVAPHRGGLYLVQGPQRVQQILKVSDESMEGLSKLFRKEHTQGSWEMSYGSRATNTQFNARIKNQTLEFDFSTLRARTNSGQATSSHRVGHHYSKSDHIQGPDGTTVTVNTSGQADHIQAELLGAALTRLSNEGTSVGRIKVGLDALETNQSGAGKLLQQLKSAGFSKSALEALESMKDSLLWQVLRGKGFDQSRLHLDADGNLAGIIFSKSARGD